MARNISSEQLRTAIDSGILPGEVLSALDENSAATLRTDVLYAASDLSRAEPPVYNEEGRPVRRPLDLIMLAQPAVNAAIEGMNP